MIHINKNNVLTFINIKYDWQLSRSIEGRDWWSYVDPNVTQEMLEELTGEFLSILKKCPSRLKKILSSSRLNPIIPNSPSMKPTVIKLIYLI